MSARSGTNLVRRFAIALAIVVGLGVAYMLAHWALIEVGREVVVLRTQNSDGRWLETRLWIVDDGGYAWLHGGDSRWMQNLRDRPVVEVERAGETHRYHAHPDPSVHARIDEALRAKYDVADRWVRFVAPDSDAATPVRLEPLDGP